ncbi:MAG: proteasome subunit beta [Candidatus Pacearchaeota archaeon]|nr:proteasome subunit beta [Candidatus Pacearchaeota archaeon]
MTDDDIKKYMKKTGTTTLGVVCKDGVILATDKRMTLGGGGMPLFVAHKKADKVFLLNDRIGVTTAGNVSDIQYTLKLTKSELKIKKLRTKMDPSVKETANLFGMLAYEAIRRFSPIIAITGFIIGGMDDKGSGLYQIDPDGSVIEHKNYVADGSGMIIAYGVLEDSWKENMSIDEGTKIAIRAVSAAMQRDTGSGEGIDVVVIDKNGARKVVEQEVRHMLFPKKK